MGVGVGSTGVGVGSTTGVGATTGSGALGAAAGAGCFVAGFGISLGILGAENAVAGKLIPLPGRASLVEQLFGEIASA